MESLIHLKGIPRERLFELFRIAQAMEEILARPVPVVPALKGKRVGFLFFEGSTRTRLSFELSARSLSLEILNLSPQGSSMIKGEGIQETLTTLKDLGLDGVVIRSPYVGVCKWARERLKVGVVNAGEGMGEHPTQALLDLYTLYKEWKGEFSGKKLAIVGDIVRSRVARSLIFSAHTLGMEVILVGPATLLPLSPPPYVRLSYELDPILEEVDALYLLRIQRERLPSHEPFLSNPQDYFFAYGLSPERFSRMKEDAVYLHPGPVNLGVELHPLLYPDQPRNLIHKQVKHGVPVRMAVFYKLFGGEGI